MLRRSQLYWARLDKRRPVLVVPIDARNARANDVIVIPCSTSCVLKCEQVTTIPQGDVTEPAIGSPLRPHRMREVERAILRALGVPA